MFTREGEEMESGMNKKDILNFNADNNVFFLLITVLI